MKNNPFHNQAGITLIELLIALIIFAFSSAAGYRLFVAQSKAYTVQDQVVEVQQNIRTAAEILLRDIRMAGFDSDRLTSKITISTPLIPGDHSIAINYEHDDTTRYTVAYWRDVVTSRLFQQLTTTKDDGSTVFGPQSVLLEYNDALNFIYGIDYDAAGNEDGVVDYWEGDSTKIGNRRVVAIRVEITAKPEPITSEVKDMVSPRTLGSTVALRNLCYKN